MVRIALSANYNKVYINAYAVAIAGGQQRRALGTSTRKHIRAIKSTLALSDHLHMLNE